MRNNKIFIIIAYFQPAFAENLLIQAKDISIDKDKEVTIFKNEVLVSSDQNHTESGLRNMIKLKEL